MLDGLFPLPPILGAGTLQDRLQSRLRGWNALGTRRPHRCQHRRQPLRAQPPPPPPSTCPAAHTLPPRHLAPRLRLGYAAVQLIDS